MTPLEMANKWAIYVHDNEVAARDAMLSDFFSVLRGKLIEYDNWLARQSWGLGEIPTAEKAVDEFLNNNQ